MYSTGFLVLGFCLFIHGVQSGIKSPYRKTEDYNTSGEKGLDNSAEKCGQQKQDLATIQLLVQNLTVQFEQFKHITEHEIHSIHQTIDQHGGGQNIHTHGGRPGSDSHTHGAHTSCGRPGGRPPYPRSFMRPPRVRGPTDFDFAVCNMKPNSKVRSNVTGRVLLMQKRNSATVMLSIRVYGFDVNQHEHTDDLTHEQDGTHDKLQDVAQARQDFSQQLNQMSKTSEKIIENGHQHGLHVHEFADLSDGCDSAGGHYNPYSARHGGPNSNIRHVGDLGNIECDEEGASNIIITDEKASLRGQYSIVGKPLVIHQTVDDYSPNFASKPGDRLACCIIEKIPSNLYNEFEFQTIKQQGVGSTSDYTQGTRPGSYDIPSGQVPGGSGGHSSNSGGHSSNSGGHSSNSGGSSYPGGSGGHSSYPGGHGHHQGGGNRGGVVDNNQNAFDSQIREPSRGKNPYSG